MAASAWMFYYTYRAKQLSSDINLLTDAIKCALLSNAYTPSAENHDLFSDVSANEIAAAFGYVAGGATLTNVTVTTTSGGYYAHVRCDPISWIASGGSITARYAVLYDADTGDLIAYCLLDTSPADVSAADGQALVLQAPASGLFYCF